METSGLFIEKLRNFRKIRDLQKLFYREQLSQQMPNGGASINHSEIEEQKVHEWTGNDVISTSLASLMQQKQTHAHLVAMAAMSYWRCDKSPIKIAMSYGRSVQSPAIGIKALT